MKIVLAGGSGQVGAILTRAFIRDGHEAVVISRHPSTTGRWVPWDGRTLAAWSTEVHGADVVVNLAGRSVNCRYSAANRAAGRRHWTRRWCQARP